MKGKLASVLVITAVLAGFDAAQAASVRKLVKEGNQAYHDGKYGDALKSYEQAGEQEPGSGRIHFNKGAALYREGDFSKALDEFEQAAAAGSAEADRELEARAQYNAGNSFFRHSEKQTADPRGAVDLLHRSVQAYQRALRLDPALTDAAHNLEVARLQIKQLLERAQKTPQSGQGQQDSQNQNLSQQLQKLLEQQQQASSQGEQLSQQQQKKGDSQDLQDKTKELSKEQQDIQQQTEQLAKQLGQQKPEQSASQQSQQQQQQVKQNLDRAASHQQQARRKMDQQQLPAAGEDQEKAEDALRQALQAAEGKPGGKPPEQQQAEAQPQQSETQPQSQQPGTPQEQQQNAPQRDGQGLEAPAESARDILDEERANRKQRQLRQMGGIRPVEKDW